MAFLWLALLLFLGDKLRRRFVPDCQQLFFSVNEGMAKALDFPKLFFDIPAAAILGIMPATTLLFFITSLCSRYQLYLFGSPLLAGLGICSLLVLSFLLLLERGNLRNFSLAKHRSQFRFPQTSPRQFFKKHWATLACLLFLAVMIYLLFSFVFYTKDAVIYSGSSVVSDYGPHLANISAFVRGDNYAPTDYPVFTGAGMRYHFFFFFFAASLHTLGLSLTFALNLASAIGLIAFSMLMGVLAVFFTKRKSALFWIQPLLYFQSSFAWVSYFRETIFLAKLKGVSFFSLLFTNQRFIGTQTHDEWGLWNMNVYANQRHLLFGLAAALLVVIFFLPTLFEKNDSFTARWFTREAWLPTDKSVWKLFLASALILLCLPYWHGAVTIALLLMLFGMAFPARHKLVYLAVAVLTLAATIVYSQVFAGGTQNVVNWNFHFGFLSEEKRVLGIFLYLLVLLGMAWPALLVLPFIMRGRIKRVLSFSMWLPLIFAMTISLTPDINVNHKYIIITRLMLCLPILSALTALFGRFEHLRFSLRRILTQSLAIIVAFFLMLSGLIDLIAYINKNKDPYTMEISSPFVQWLEQNTDQRAIFVTPTWFYHGFFYSGRQAWYGYPYYAWSAGYNSIQREQEYNALWTGFDGDFEYFKEFINLHHLEFAIIDQSMRINQAGLDEDFFIRNFPMLREFSGHEAITVYDLRPYLSD